MAKRPRVGDPAPPFEGKTQGASPFRLEAHRGGWVVLYFYPKDGTYGCTREACGFRNLSTEFEALGATIVGVSHDSVESHAAFAARRRLGFPLVSDPDGSITRAYGASTWYGWPKRLSFLIDPEGRIAKVYRVHWAKGHPGRVLKDLEQTLGPGRHTERPKRPSQKRPL